MATIEVRRPKAGKPPGDEREDFPVLLLHEGKVSSVMVAFLDYRIVALSRDCAMIILCEWRFETGGKV